MSRFSEYYKAVSYIHALSSMPMKGNHMVDRKKPSVYLKRMRYFLGLLGNPDRGMKYIHITGTAGKGTVAGMVHRMLVKSGRQAGLFTSPSVTTEIEKIQVGNMYISPSEFVKIVNYLKPLIKKAHEHGPYGRPSTFEIYLAVAFIYFKQQKCEWIVLEVGLGGRYDATNVIEKPIITAITNIGLDHTEILGKTLGRIAYDKAGIIKRGALFFTTESRASLIKVFERVAGQKNVVVQKLDGKSFYQDNNKALARAIVGSIGMGFVSNLGDMRLPCRFEIMQHKPLVILDGAHNSSKIKTTIVNLKRLKYRRLYLIIAIAQNKDYKGILRQIAPLANYIFVTQFTNKDRVCVSPSELLTCSKTCTKKGVIGKIFMDPRKALVTALKEAEPTDLILATGSFFLAGALRAQWFSEEWVLKHRKSFLDVSRS